MKIFYHMHYHPLLTTLPLMKPQNWHWQWSVMWWQNYTTASSDTMLDWYQTLCLLWVEENNKTLLILSIKHTDDTHDMVLVTPFHFIIAVLEPWQAWDKTKEINKMTFGWTVCDMKFKIVRAKNRMFLYLSMTMNFHLFDYCIVRVVYLT